MSQEIDTYDCDDESWKNNRERVRAPRLGLAWCGGCDREMAPTDGKKCPNCGYINGRYRNKKG